MQSTSLLAFFAEVAVTSERRVLIDSNWQDSGYTSKQVALRSTDHAPNRSQSELDVPTSPQPHRRGIRGNVESSHGYPIDGASVFSSRKRSREVLSRSVVSSRVVCESAFKGQTKHRNDRRPVARTFATHFKVSEELLVSFGVVRSGCHIPLASSVDADVVAPRRVAYNVSTNSWK